MVVGHILMDHTCSLMCTNHRDMTAHTPDFLTKSGTNHIYVEHSTARHSLISHLWSNASRTVTHPFINWDHDCLTSVIKHKMFVPCYAAANNIVNECYFILLIGMAEYGNVHLES